MISATHTTRILLDAASGDSAAASQLLPLVYDELRGLAARQLARERPDHTLQATALVHEAYLRLVDQTRVDWAGKTHFLAVSAEMIRRILVDHARKHAAAKRGGDRRQVALADGLAADAGDHVDLVELEGALTELTKLNARQGRVVELRFYAGLGVEQAALVLGVSERTVKADWRFARAWLGERLNR